MLPSPTHPGLLTDLLPPDTGFHTVITTHSGEQVFHQGLHSSEHHGHALVRQTLATLAPGERLYADIYAPDGRLTYEYPEQP